MPGSFSLPKYLTRNRCEFWQIEPDAVQGGECAAVRALQAGANAATRRFWQPKTHLFIGKDLGAPNKTSCLSPGNNAVRGGLMAHDLNI
jgi:hypothetical protein